MIDFDALRREAARLDALGLRHAAARILAAIEVAPDERIAPVQDARQRDVPLAGIPWGLPPRRVIGGIADHRCRDCGSTTPHGSAVFPCPGPRTSNRNKVAG